MQIARKNTIKYLSDALKQEGMIGILNTVSMDDIFDQFLEMYGKYNGSYCELHPEELLHFINKVVVGMATKRK
jgi:hypothetical protein